MIEVENLSKRYGEKLAVDGLDFVVQPGMDEPTAGRVRVSGRDYRAAPAPMAELGILLEARAMHTGRPAMPISSSTRRRMTPLAWASASR